MGRICPGGRRHPGCRAWDRRSPGRTRSDRDLRAQHDLDAGWRIPRLAIHTRLLTSHHLLPLLITEPGGLLVEVTDGTTETSASQYRASVSDDLAFSQGHELEPCDATAGAVTPGWLRSEMMLDAYAVTEDDWRDAPAPDRASHPPRKASNHPVSRGGRGGIS